MNEFPLKDCPCCGGQPLTIVDRIGGQLAVSIECSSCGLTTAPVTGRRMLTGLRQQAGDMWNRRPWDGLDIMDELPL